MMAELIFKASHNTPYVFLSDIEGYCEISGPSYATYISNIYNPILKWINEEFQLIEKQINFIFKFEILNSVSYKFIIEIIMLLNEFVKEGKEITVKWYYIESDDDILGSGEDLSELFEIPFELIEEK
jgi:hypothetical protein